MSKIKFQITEDIFNNKYLTALMDFMAFVSPAKTVDEKAIRERDKKLVAEEKFGDPVERIPALRDGKLDRDRFLMGVSIFGATPAVTERDIKLISDAGFDFIINGNSGEYGDLIYDWCEKYNLAAIGYEVGSFLNRDLKTVDYSDPHVFDGFVSHPAAVGDCVFDEPHTSDFCLVSRFHDACRRLLPDRFIFTNLLPAGAVKSALGASSYKEYVDRYSAEIDSDYLSVDIYPFHPSSIINKAEMAICLNTYDTLGNACRRDGKDFWLYIQSQMRWFSHLYTMTTFEMIKWQIYASICYGCRSIIHASYNPVWGDDAIGIIDYDGNLTEQYLYVRRVNAEIAKLAPVLKEYRSLGVKFTDAAKLNHHFVFACPKQKKSNKLRGFDGIKQVKKIESEGTALAGFFENAEGKNALMLVNCKNIYDPYASQKITVTFSGRTAFSVYEHGELVRKEEADSVTVNPGSCDGIFIVLD